MRFVDGARTIILDSVCVASKSNEGFFAVCQKNHYIFLYSLAKYWPMRFSIACEMEMNVKLLVYSPDQYEMGSLFSL